MRDAVTTYLQTIGAKGGKRAAKRLGKLGRSDRAKRGWQTRKARKPNGRRRGR